MTKAEGLQKLKVWTLERKDKLPLGREANNLVLGEGNLDAMFMFIGEAPGFHEDKLGRPFVGLAGRLLDKSLVENGMSRDEVYITNVVKARPPENRDPTPEEIAAYKPIIDKQIEIIDPPVIVTLGRFSMAKFLGDVKISAVHGRPKMVGKRVVVPLYHPAAALRNGAVLEQFREDFGILNEIKADLDGFRNKLNKVTTPPQNNGQVGLF